MNTVSHVVSVEEQGVRLTKTEYAILKLLMQNPTQVITKSLMLDRISEDYTGLYGKFAECSISAI